MVGGTDGAPGASIAILLSVYNGEAYLNAQLDSILAQSHRDWVLYWRDDGSEDASRAIMLSFQAHRGQGRCVEVEQPEGRIGITESYLALLRAVPDDVVVAFADQDDFWLPEKLAWGLEALGPGMDEPALYCARQYLTDSALAVRGKSALLHRRPDFATALTQNIATGHTILLNPAAQALLCALRPPAGVLHDWWAYLLVTSVGGRVFADPRCVSYYRQHGGNVVGALSWPRRGIAAVRRGPAAFMTIFSANLERLAEGRALLTPAANALLDDLRTNLPRGILARAAILWRRPDLARQTRVETAVFRLWFLLTSGRR